MKLYATVIGLKAGKQVEKGQGSNQSLQVEILAEGLKGIPTRANVYRLSLNIGNDNELQAELLNYETGEVLELTKGKKQKGDNLFESTERTIKRLKADVYDRRGE